MRRRLCRGSESDVWTEGHATVFAFRRTWLEMEFARNVRRHTERAGYAGSAPWFAGLSIVMQ